jgi:hypothetical protein
MDDQAGTGDPTAHRSLSFPFFFFFFFFFVFPAKKSRIKTKERNSIMTTVFSLEGKTLKLNTAEDVAPYVKELDAIENLEEIRLSGNTLGVEASKAIAAALKKKDSIKVLTCLVCMELVVLLCWGSWGRE